MIDRFLHNADKVSLESWSASLECWCWCHANSCGASRGTACTIQVYFLWGGALGQPQSKKWCQRPAQTHPMAKGQFSHKVILTWGGRQQHLFWNSKSPVYLLIGMEMGGGWGQDQGSKDHNLGQHI